MAIQLKKRLSIYNHINKWMNKEVAHPPVVLSIAGSDSGGGAGIQADLKTFQNLGVFGTTAITAITCQNTRGVSAVQGVEHEILQGQIESIMNDFDVKAIKTGMLYSKEIIEVVSQMIDKYSLAYKVKHARELPIIMDPVMISSTGHSLFKKEAEETLKSILKKVTLITPNIPEAEVLTNIKIYESSDMEYVAKKIYESYGVKVLLKGGHLHEGNAPSPLHVVSKRNKIRDVFFDGKAQWFIFDKIHTTCTHGTGCTLSAAICAYMALGFKLQDAILKARVYLQRALLRPIDIANRSCLRADTIEEGTLSKNLQENVGPVNHNFIFKK